MENNPAKLTPPTYTPVTVAGVRGFLFSAVGEEPALAFVPDYAILPDGALNRDAYLADRWAYANNYANPDAPGSHVWPDMARPARDLPPEWGTFSERLAQRISGAA